MARRSTSKFVQALRTANLAEAKQIFCDIMQQKVAARLHEERTRLNPLEERYNVTKNTADTLAKGLMSRGVKAISTSNRDGYYVEVIGVDHHYLCNPNEGHNWVVDVLDTNDDYHETLTTALPVAETDITKLIQGILPVLKTAMQKHP